MRPSTITIFTELAAESFRDAARRRIVPVVVVLALFSLLAVDSCTSCVGSMTSGGAISPSRATGWAGMMIFNLLSLWTMVLAGLLASDHLAETLSDGSANLVLSRPVRRSEFALARLVGALGIAQLTGAVVLTVSTILIYLQHGVSIASAIIAALACAAGSIVVAALAMATSLVMTRVATALCVFFFVFAVAFSNALGLVGLSLGGLGHALQYFTPPLSSAVVVALGPWIDPAVPPVDPYAVVLKLVFWMVVSVGLLLAAFQRQELKA
jgi:ABC-type transport system involved in multi-copper enzyme maturation permease subunit